MQFLLLPIIMDLIRAIREEYGLDINVDDEQAKSAIGKLTQTVENASQRYV